MTVPLDPGTRRLLQRALCKAFPDAHVRPSDVEAFALALQRGAADPGPEGELPPELAYIDWSGCAQELSELARSEYVNLDGAPEHEGGVTRILRSDQERERDKARYYWVEATHTRKQPSGYAPFTGQLPMVRVRLPAREPRDFLTAVGTVEPEDHLIATLAEANEHFAARLGYSMARVDLITPPRQLLRFGAVSVMLGYRDAELAPSCYILEAGTATGQPKVLFLGQNMQSVIDAPSGYKPTPFACADHVYTGRLSVQNDSPKLLEIKARKLESGTSQPHYIEVNVRFTEEQDAIRNVWSGLLIARAASIVLARQARGLPDGCGETREPPPPPVD